MRVRNLSAVLLAVVLGVLLLTLGASAVAAHDGDGGVAEVDDGVATNEQTDLNEQDRVVALSRTETAATRDRLSEQASTTEDTIEVYLDPEANVGPAGEEATFTLAATGADGGSVGSIRAYSLELEIDSGVATFFEDGVEFLQSPNSAFTDVTVQENGSKMFIDFTFDENSEPVEEIALAEITVDVQNVDAGATTDVSFLDAEFADPDLNSYPVETRNSTLTASPEMSLELPDQQLGSDETAVVESVTSNGANATLLLTYVEADDQVVAGVTTGVFDGENATVSIGDFGGFSEDQNGSFVGNHTVHILPAGAASGTYQPGDVLSPETAVSVINRSTATLETAEVPLQGLGVTVVDGFTIADDYPQNQRDIFGAPGSIYDQAEISLPPETEPADERFAPVAGGQHVGLTGLPVNHKVYGWATDLLNFQEDAPAQTVAISFDGTENSPVTFDYSETLDRGLEIANPDSILDDTENINQSEFDLTVDNTAGEVLIEFDETTVGPESPTIQFELVWGAVDPVEGLDVDAPGGIDEVGHSVVTSDSEQESDNFVVVNAGTTGISYVDTDNENSGFLSEPANETDLEAFADEDGAASGTANDGSFLVWQGQVMTFETESRGGSVDIYEPAVDEGGDWTLGEAVSGDVLTRPATTPSQVVNLDTSALSPGEYFVTFGGNDDAVVLDIRELSLGAEPENGTIEFGAQDDVFEIDVTSEDASAEPPSNIEVWYRHEGDLVSDVVHIERQSLAGNGTGTVEIIPEDSLVGLGNYTATVLHSESGVTTTVEFAIKGPSSLPGFENEPQDLDGNGLYEDIDGDDTFDIFDVQAFFNTYESTAVQNSAAGFDFNEDGGIDIADVQALFDQLG